MTAQFTFITTSEEQTADMAVQIGSQLGAGDTVLLHGPVGAGKSVFCRALIQSRLDRHEDVPSPTFTLVQIYSAADTEIWHADLYRLGSPDEIIELGLLDAMETALCLIEWPDRLGYYAPENALHITLNTQDATRPETERSLTLAGPKAASLKDSLDA